MRVRTPITPVLAYPAPPARRGLVQLAVAVLLLCALVLLARERTENDALHLELATRCAHPKVPTQVMVGLSDGRCVLREYTGPAAMVPKAQGRPR